MSAIEVKVIARSMNNLEALLHNPLRILTRDPHHHNSIIAQRHIMRQHHLLPHDRRPSKTLEGLLACDGEVGEGLLEGLARLGELGLGDVVGVVAVRVDLVAAGREVFTGQTGEHGFEELVGERYDFGVREAELPGWGLCGWGVQSTRQSMFRAERSEKGGEGVPLAKLAQGAKLGHATNSGYASAIIAVWPGVSISRMTSIPRYYITTLHQPTVHLYQKLSERLTAPA